MTPPVAELRGVERRFGAVAALSGATVSIHAGEVHAILGENGAGKSTLLGILGGMLQPDAGMFEIRGVQVDLRSPRDAWAHGVGLVHQHFTLVPALSVLDNLALGRRSIGKGFGLPYERIRADTSTLMRRTGLTVDVDAVVGRLGVGDRQRVEILKALSRNPPILALDEPTAVLAPPEVDSLFALLRELAAEGRAVVLVAHKIDEVLSVADRVTVLRKGRTVLSAPRADVDAPTLIEAMVGADAAREAGTGVGSGARTPGARSAVGGEVVARLESVTARSSDGVIAVREAFLEVRRGEIVGIAGVEGNGQRELASLLAGRLDVESGSRHLPAGIGFVPQDRTTEGVVADFDLVENVALALHAEPRFASGPLLRWDALRHEAAAIRRRFDVVAPGLDAPAWTLSGGNQQRLVVGRELARARDLLVAEDPTRGLDVAATAFVHRELRRLAAAEGGPGIVLVSTDLDLVLELSSRILVMTRGALVPLPDEGWSREVIGSLMLGGRRGAD